MNALKVDHQHGCDGFGRQQRSSRHIVEKGANPLVVFNPRYNDRERKGAFTPRDCDVELTTRFVEEGKFERRDALYIRGIADVVGLRVGVRVPIF
jgi:hypothetical protein